MQFYNTVQFDNLGLDCLYDLPIEYFSQCCLPYLKGGRVLVPQNQHNTTARSQVLDLKVLVFKLSLLLAFVFFLCFPHAGLLTSKYVSKSMCYNNLKDYGMVFATFLW